MAKSSNSVLMAFNNNCYFWLYSKPRTWWKIPIYHPWPLQIPRCRDWNEDTNIFLSTGISFFHLPRWKSCPVAKGYGCTSEYIGISWLQMHCYYNAAVSNNVQEKGYYDKANRASPPKNSLISKLFTHVNFSSPCCHAVNCFALI